MSSAELRKPSFEEMTFQELIVSYLSKDPSSLLIATQTDGMTVSFEFFARVLQDWPDLLKFSGIFHEVVHTELVQSFFNNKKLSAREQRALYGEKGPYQWYRSSFPSVPSHLFMLQKHSVKQWQAYERIARLAEFHWHLALLQEEGERLQKDEKTKELGAKAIDLCRQLKVEGNNTKVLLLKAMKDFEHTPLEKLLNCISDCFNALWVVLRVKERPPGQHGFFRPHAGDFVRGMLKNYQPAV